MPAAQKLFSTETIRVPGITNKKHKICSVYPVVVYLNGGRHGNYTLPPFDEEWKRVHPECPAYSFVEIRPGVMHKDEGEGQFKAFHMYTARTMALDFIGVELTPVTDEATQEVTGYVEQVNSRNLLDRGIFVPEGDAPTEAEIAQARSNLVTYFRSLIPIADEMWVSSNKRPKQIDNNARIAAKYLGIRREWAEVSGIAGRLECPACGEFIKPGIAKCPHCDAILDRKKAAEFGLFIPEPRPAAAPESPTKKGF